MNESVQKLEKTTALLLLLVASCSARTPQVPTGVHPSNAPQVVRVGFPPPPAPIEMLPLQRRDECRWRDGHYEWDGQSWTWIPGAWVLPPPGCYYALPELRWVRSGGTSQLLYKEPRWYPNPEEPLETRCEQPRACASLLPEDADTDPNDLSSPSQKPTSP